MARYKVVDTQPRFLPIDLAHQLLPGTFEHALSHLLDNELDLSDFDTRFRKHATGASAALEGGAVAYSRGLISSRAMAAACREQVTFMALTGDRPPRASRPWRTSCSAWATTLPGSSPRCFVSVTARG